MTDPNYSETPILQQIAKYAEEMAPAVHAWGMQQYEKHHGDIDALMRDAQTYASPPRIAAETGETGEQQADDTPAADGPANDNAANDPEPQGAA
jgi:hypothetical protein